MKPASNGQENEVNIVKRLGVWVLVVAGVLMVPLLTHAPWSGSDFVIGGVLLFGAALVYELLTRRVGSRVAVGFVVAIVLFLVWAELSVGVFGTPFAGS